MESWTTTMECGGSWWGKMCLNNFRGGFSQSFFFCFALFFMFLVYPTTHHRQRHIFSGMKTAQKENGAWRRRRHKNISTSKCISTQISFACCFRCLQSSLVIFFSFCYKHWSGYIVSSKRHCCQLPLRLLVANDEKWVSWKGEMSSECFWVASNHQMKLLRNNENDEN